jgi:hypothetical protein
LGFGRVDIYGELRALTFVTSIIRLLNEPGRFGHQFLPASSPNALGLATLNFTTEHAATTAIQKIKLDDRKI